MKYHTIYLAVMFISCGGTSQEQTETASDQSETTNERSCLAEVTDPTKWYPLSDVASLVNVPEESIDQRANEKMHYCQYHWKTDRTYLMKAGNSEIEVPTNNTIAITIKNLDEAIEKASRMHKRSFTYAEYFNGFYSQVSKEDMEQIDKSLDKKAEEDKDFDAKTAKSLLAAAKTENYAKLNDLGDDAIKSVKTAPGLRETRLVVLYGNVVLLINIDISDEDADDLTAAKTVAEAIMNICH